MSEADNKPSATDECHVSLCPQCANRNINQLKAIEERVREWQTENIKLLLLIESLQKENLKLRKLYKNVVNNIKDLKN